MEHSSYRTVLPLLYYIIYFFNSKVTTWWCELHPVHTDQKHKLFRSSLGSSGGTNQTDHSPIYKIPRNCIFLKCRRSYVFHCSQGINIWSGGGKKMERQKYILCAYIKMPWWEPFCFFVYRLFSGMWCISPNPSFSVDWIAGTGLQVTVFLP